MKKIVVEVVGIEPTSETTSKARPTCVVCIYGQQTSLSGLRVPSEPRMFFTEFYRQFSARQFDSATPALVTSVSRMSPPHARYR